MTTQLLILLTLWCGQPGYQVQPMWQVRECRSKAISCFNYKWKKQVYSKKQYFPEDILLECLQRIEK